MKEFWNERYSQKEFAYGDKPNEYLKTQLDKLTLGTALFPADGEGRNSVYAAKLGWKVSAFDISQEGRNKAELLAKKQDVSIDYKVGDLSEIDYFDEQFDVIVLIFAHFPSNLKSLYHNRLAKYLKKGGLIILEAFNKKHLEFNSKNAQVGGPKDIDMLFSREEIILDFNSMEVIELYETEIDLDEGLYHKGKGSVVRFVGRKK